MKYVVLVSHGEFAPGLHSAVKMMTGDREDVLSTSLKDGMGADQFAENFKELVKDIKTDDQIILLADILSGSPFTNALNVLSEKGMLPNTLVIAGMNMPLALTAVLMKDNFDNLDEFAEALLNEGRSGVTRFDVSEDDDEDEDL
ncbi:PTS sugar transporter subunit IIA [Catenisphaera adipataccumulans]|uniref:PTS system N-acetylgalactosamine-specific IIA component n=1 Tax=Catenisphaera adipataccumulans TaxID=700500 RepID=A0A7W8CZP7_9FIRM|nr:PTS sugar transporter subunit IIA [Catenisphaera adipataccumulans]MBB5183423.1 PTS system N-acetylgalactosamine-specific IIA component [Catenisphaera adipataccumulans]